MRGKKGISLIILVLIIVGILGIGTIIAVSVMNKNASNPLKNASNISEEEQKFVGRWVYVDQQAHRFIDLYCDGTGWTNYYVSGSYDGVALKWTYDEVNGLAIYTALHCDDDEKQDENGFYVTSSKNGKLESFTVPEIADNTHGYVEPLSEITLMRISGNRLINAAECDDEYGYVAKDSSIRTDFSEFKDGKKYNINSLGYDSIDMYIDNPSTYRENLIIP